MAHWLVHNPLGIGSNPISTTMPQFFDFSAARHMASFLIKKSVTHVSAGARRNILEIPVLQAGKLGYGKHVRVV